MFLSFKDKKILADFGIYISESLKYSSSSNRYSCLQKMFGSGITISIILNQEMNDTMKLVKSLEESCLLIKSVRENKQKTKRRISRNVIRHISASLLGNLLTGKEVMREAEGTIRTGHDF